MTIHGVTNSVTTRHTNEKKLSTVLYLISLYEIMSTMLKTKLNILCLEQPVKIVEQKK